MLIGVASTACVRIQDLFDINAEPLKGKWGLTDRFTYEASEPDLFAHPSSPGSSAITGTAALEIAQVVPPQEKLDSLSGVPAALPSLQTTQAGASDKPKSFFYAAGFSFFRYG